MEKVAAQSRAWGAAGFIDLHCHGAAGHSFDSADRAGIEHALDVHHAHGTMSLLLSLVSAHPEVLARRLQVLRVEIAAVNATGAGGIAHQATGAEKGSGGAAPSALDGSLAALPRVLGVHLEGPFLAPARRGAHDPAALTAPTPDAVEALLTAGEGVLAQVTIAPELPGALDAIDRFVAAGVIVAVGHTDADADTAAAAFDRGASLLTHAYNAMPGLAHRAPGPLGAALDRPGVSIEVIADGIHVHPTVLRALFAAAPGRVALVSDAMAATGLGDGAYRLGTLDVEVHQGRPVLAGTDTLAGSTLTLDRAVEVVTAAGVALDDAVAAATRVPAAVLGLAVPG